MDQHEYNNWKLIKEIMEERGNTDNMFYKRAVEILKTGRDPLYKFFNQNDNEPR
jgi:hypothetical protein